MDSALRESHGNALLEAVPPLVDQRTAMRALVRRPRPPTDALRQAPLHVRLDSLEAMQETFVPLERTADALMRIHGLIRWSYSYRNPAHPDVQRALHKLAASGLSAELPRTSSGGGGAIGLALPGVTGGGKTSFIDGFLRYFGTEPVVHSSIGGRACRWTQIPVLRVQCPVNGDLKALAKDVLGRIDDLLGTRHVRGTSRFNPSELLSRTTSVCSSLLLGALIVDDVQYLQESRRSSKQMLQFFCNFMERTGIPVILCGTYKLLYVLRSDLGLGSKLSAKGALNFAPLEPDTKEFQLLTAAYWEYSVLRSSIPMPDHLPRLLFLHSRGVPRLMRMAMAALHRRMAVSEGHVVPLEEHFRRIALDELLMYQDALDVLSRLSAGTLQRGFEEYEDFIPPQVKPDRIRALEPKDATTRHQAPSPKLSGRSVGHRKAARRA